MGVDRDFVERRDESFYVVGSRVPLASIVREFLDGQSPEAIRSAFPTLTLEQVYGAITFYLGHRHEVDEDLAARERVEDTFSETHPAPADLKEKLERARRQPAVAVTRGPLPGGRQPPSRDRRRLRTTRTGD